MNLVFDFGGVLFAWKPADMLARHFPQEAGDPVRAAALAHAVFGDADWHAFDRGTLEMDTVVQRTCLRLQLDGGQLHALVRNIGELLTPMADTVAVLQKLHRQRAQQPDLRLYYLSNMPQSYARTLQQRHAFLNCFDGGVFSGDVQYIKPEPEIYHLLQSRYALNPAQTVFIDDMAGNVHAAQRLGWQGIHFRSAQQLQEALADLDI